MDTHMSNKIKTATKKLIATDFVRKMKEALMVKTGIKAGHEFTGGN